MATVLSTTETELIGFQSQLCRVSYQSVPRPPTPSSISPLQPPPLQVPHSWLFLSTQQPSVNDAALEMRTYPNLTDCRIGLARLFFGRECGLCSRRFQWGFRTRRGSSRVSSCVKRGQRKGTEAGCSRINKGSPESDRWKDKQTERNERVWITVESSRR